MGIVPSVFIPARLSADTEPAGAPSKCPNRAMDGAGAGGDGSTVGRGMSVAAGAAVGAANVRGGVVAVGALSTEVRAQAVSATAANNKKAALRGRLK